MNRLSFENIDVVNTPLSSLRSCSEYQTRLERKITGGSMAKRSWSVFRWTLFSGKKRRKHRVRFADTDETEKEFMVDRFRFNSSNLLVGECHSHTPERLISTNYRISSDPSSFQKRHISVSDMGYWDTKKRRSFVEEASWLIDVMFGFGLANSTCVKEIELQDLKPPQVLAVYDTSHSDVEIETAELESRGSGVGIRRITSLWSLERIHEEAVRPPTEGHGGSESNVSNRSFHQYVQFLVEELKSWYEADDIFYESIRIQPFSSGAYLRGMLLAGMSGLVFQVYSLISWPLLDYSALTLYQLALLRINRLNLCVQIVVSIISLPCRLQIHFQCWESSRSIEVDVAIRLIRSMVHGDSWLLNKVIGQILDLLALFNIVLVEIFLWMSSSEDPLRGLLISLCATNVLTFVCRIIVATMYSLSMHDPQVLMEARRRGLSKWDLEILPTFVYSCRDEVNNSDCSICLACFDMGEMLISLPCDKKHSFHAACIRQWLQRQNSCPLCQKLV